MSDGESGKMQDWLHRLMLASLHRPGKREAQEAGQYCSRLVESCITNAWDCSAETSQAEEGERKTSPVSCSWRIFSVKGKKRHSSITTNEADKHLSQSGKNAGRAWGLFKSHIKPGRKFCSLLRDMELGTATQGWSSRITEPTSGTSAGLVGYCPAAAHHCSCPGAQHTLRSWQSAFLGARGVRTDSKAPFFFLPPAKKKGFVVLDSSVVRREISRKQASRKQPETWKKIEPSFQRSCINNRCVSQAWMKFTEGWNREAFFKSLCPVSPNLVKRDP